MIELLQDFLGITDHEYLLIWFALIILTICLYCIFKVLLTIMMRIGGYK